ncbi:kinase-like protein [Aspergillus neoniger CBS 115656]|uniref:Kinase-like protein n=1 Tax=Aspergillus neoniger (strain CBS 115656) TaxID=1448310 RepID=A0A318Y9Y5_ASPNB|nr:kinase-like protein [Aspergillus neoniger CBS 115656]PYH30779.1 kinase-like protein [Aspergillus neoniger CBS 115656]
MRYKFPICYSFLPSSPFPSICKPCLRHQLFQSNRKCISTLTKSRQTPLPPGTTITCDSNQTYRIEKLLTHGGKSGLHVYRANTTTNNKQYIIKTNIPGDFQHQLNIQNQLSSCSNIRTFVNSVRETEVFIYPFLSGDLLRFSQRRMISHETRKRILRDALSGLVEMHERDMVHNDIKPNNILIDYTDPTTTNNNRQPSIKSIQISDLEDTVIVPPGKWLRGPLCGNALWRSAESWARSRQNQASDVFSFALVMVYVMANEMVLRVPDEQLNAEDSWRYVLRLHLSYFADIEGVERFLEHIGEQNPFFERILELINTFGLENPRQPVEHWDFLEPELKDLVARMTYLDPRGRITAREALEPFGLGD